MIAIVKTSILEPGIYQILRWSVGLRLFILLPSVLGALTVGPHDLPERRLFPLGWLGLVEVLILVGYVFWPPIQRRLGRFFLPIAIILLTTGPLIQQYLILLNPSSRVVSLAGAWQLVPLLFIPLILTAAQYRMRAVWVYCLATYFIDLAWIILTPAGPDRSLIPLVSVPMVRTFSFLLVGYMIVRLMASQRQQRQALTQANQQLTHYAAALEQLTTSRERNRMARELHDTLAHSLSGLAVQLEAVKSIWEDDPSGARVMLDQSLAATRSGLTETRRALQALRATPLEDLGLALAVSALADSITRRTGVELDLQIASDLPGLSPDVEQTVYRVAQEALENVARHAGATRVQLCLASGPNGAVDLTVSDNGRGFDPAQPDLDDKFGLSGMRERARVLGGSLAIDTHLGQGTTIRLVCGGSQA